MVPVIFSVLARSVAPFKFISTCLLTTCAAFNVLSTTDSVQAAGLEATAFRWFQADVAEGTASAWFRCSLDPSIAGAEEALLAIAAEGRCSVYVNGQRILKNVTLEKSDSSIIAAGYQVKSLLREGRNLIAVESHSDTKSVIFGISIMGTSDGKSREIGGQWKTVAKQPPVGWQQTDFNDRDWPEFKPLPEDSAARLMVSGPEKFNVPVIPPKARTAPFQFEDGDHIVMAGATFFERAQLSEHMEASLTASLGHKRVTFRNLGWSADTVFADSRGIFDRPEVGFLRMVEHIRAEEPTVAFVCYGQNEALTAGMTPEAYAGQLNRLLDELEASGIACVLISPHELLSAKPPIPSPARFNPKIRVFSEATQSLAQGRGLLFVDLFSDFARQMFEADAVIRAAARTSDSDAANPMSRLSENGMHLSDHGYACAAVVFRERLLGTRATSPSVRVDVGRQMVDGEGVKVRNVRFGEGPELVSFEIQEDTLSPLPLNVIVDKETADQVQRATIQSVDQAEAAADLTKISSDSSKALQSFVAAENSQYERLRAAIVKKNELYFHRWRPQNITYLFGFRKHEQGNNAADIAKFDPFIEALEKQIHELKQPGWRTVVLKRK